MAAARPRRRVRRPGRRRVEQVVGGPDARIEELVTHGAPPATSSASRSSDGRVGVARQVAQDVAHLVGAVPEPGERLAHVGHRRTLAAASPPAFSSTGIDSRSRSSTISRSAVFLPTPGTSDSAAVSLLATMSTMASGGCVASTAIASAGPMPCAPMSTWNVPRSSRAANPYSVWVSSRMWWCT